MGGANGWAEVKDNNTITSNIKNTLKVAGAEPRNLKLQQKSYLHAKVHTHIVVCKYVFVSFLVHNIWLTYEGYKLISSINFTWLMESCNDWI